MGVYKVWLGAVNDFAESDYFVWTAAIAFLLPHGGACLMAAVFGRGHVPCELHPLF